MKTYNVLLRLTDHTPHIVEKNFDNDYIELELQACCDSLTKNGLETKLVSIVPLPVGEK